MQNFQNYLLLESILNVDTYFYRIIKNLKERDMIAKQLFNLFNQDIKTNLNYLKPSDNNQDILFVNDTQVQRIIDKGENPFDKAINRSKIGRGVQQILKLNNINVTQSEIEKFVNNYKVMYDLLILRKSPKDSIKLVTGGEIRHWYNQKNYVRGGGVLNNSCMKYEECEDFLEIYIQNPDVCQLLIFMNDDDPKKINGRALVWKLTSGKYYLDRIYARHDYQTDIIYNYFKEIHPDGLTHYEDDNSDYDLYVTIKETEFEFYPYMDTLFCLYDNTLSNIRPDEETLYKELRDTEGEYEIHNGIWSKKLRKYINKVDAIKIGFNDYVTKDMCQWSEYENDYVFNDNVVVSDKFGILNIQNSIEMEIDGVKDWYPNNELIEIYDKGKITKTLKKKENLEQYTKAENNGKIFYTKDPTISVLFGNDFHRPVPSIVKYIVNDNLEKMIKDKTLIEVSIVKDYKKSTENEAELAIFEIGKTGIFFIPTKLSDEINYQSITNNTYIDVNHIVLIYHQKVLSGELTSKQEEEILTKIL